MRVVLDTNVFVSAVLGGVVAPILDRWGEGAFVMIVSDEILGEYNDVLRRPKFGLEDETVYRLLVHVFHAAEVVTPDESIQVIAADPADDKFLAAAVAGRADCIVSGDRHLLQLNVFRGIPIITAREFIERLGGKFFLRLK